MNFSKLLTAISALTMALGFYSCSGGGGGGSGPSGYVPTAADLFVQELNKELGGASTYQFNVIKETSARGGGWVVVSKGNFTDPSSTINPSTGMLCQAGDTDPACTPSWIDNGDYAINVSAAPPNSSGTGLNFFNATSVGLTFDPASSLYVDSFGNKYEKQGTVIKDLNVLGAKADQIRRGIYAHELQSRYGLSVERSTAIAKMGVNLQSLAKQNGGSVPEKDAAAFEQFAFGGLRVKTVIEHVQSGDKAAFEKDKKTIADANGLSVEDVTFLIQNTRL